MAGVNFSDKVAGNWEAGLDGLAKKLKNNVARAGAQAMAQAVYDDAKRLAPISEGPHVFHGTHAKYEFNAGTLRASIYQVYSQDRSTGERKEYHVSWNHQKCPYGFMVEFGTSRAPAHPFLWPAYEQNRARLVQLAAAAMAGKLSEIGT